MRVIRWILGITVAVVLLAVAAVLLATLVINPDHYKGELASAVRRATGRPFVLQGHLRLTWFPWLGLRLGPAQLGNPPRAGGADLLDWQSAHVRIRLLPLLLQRRLEVGRIRIVGADIHLRRGPHGRGSWDDLLARFSAAPRTAGAGAPSSPTPTATLGGLDLVNGSLDYVDAGSREHVRLTDWQLNVGPWRAGAPLSLRTRFLLHLDTLGSGATPAGAGPLRLPAAGVRVVLHVPRLTLAENPLGVGAPQWSLQVGDARLHGAIDAGRDASGALLASGSVAAAVPSVRQLAGMLGIGMPALEDPAALGGLSLSGSWRYHGGILEIAPLAAKLDATTLSGWLTRAPLGSTRAGSAPESRWTFALRADQLDFDRYLTRPQGQRPLALPLAALRALHAQGTLELAHAQLDGTILQDVRLQVQ